MFESNWDFITKSNLKYFKNQPAGSPSETEMFTDTYFPPSNNSLLALDVNGIPLDQIAYDKNKKNLDENETEWKRLSEIFSEYEMFVGKIEMDDIKQGSLGNCYFLSALASLTEYPKLITNMFRNEKNKGGYYEIVLFIDGEWQVVIVDDYFPTSKKDGKLIFCKPNLNEIWAILLEKAWAKVNGGYLNTIGGLCGEVLQVITGAPYIGLNNIQIPKEKLWKELYNSIKKNYVIGTGTVESNWIDKVGLAGQHAYSVLALEEVQVNGNKYQLIKLRNPWGKTEWNGEWSDSSPLWTEELKEKLQLKVEDDGAFWMSFDEYVRFYDQADIAYLQFDSQNYGHIINDPDVLKHPLVYKLNIYTKTSLTVSLISKITRFNRSTKNEGKGFTVVIASALNNCPHKIITGSYSTKEMLSFLTDLEEGQYFIFIHSGGVTNPALGELKVKFSLGASAYLTFEGYDKNFEVLRSLTKEKIEEEYKALYENKEYFIGEVQGFIQKYGVLPIFFKNNRRKPMKITFSLYMNFGVIFAPVFGKEYNKNETIEITLPPRESFTILMVAGLTCYTEPIIGIGQSYCEILPLNFQVETSYNSEIVRIETGSTYSYYINSVSSSKNSEQYHLSGKKSLDDLYTETNFNNSYYEFLKEWSPIPGHSDLDLIWNKMEFDDNLYIGQLNQNGKFHGIGLLKESFNLYVGYFENGLKEIKGKTYQQFDGDNNINYKFECEFKNNKMLGMGTEYVLQTRVFVGQLNDGIKVEGLSISWSTIWKGKFLNDKKHGVGVLYFISEKVGFEFEYEWDDNITEMPSDANHARDLGLKEVQVDQEEFSQVIPG